MLGIGPGQEMRVSDDELEAAGRAPRVRLQVVRPHPLRSEARESLGDHGHGWSL